jgi:hypothetical protein
MKCVSYFVLYLRDITQQPTVTVGRNIFLPVGVD